MLTDQIKYIKELMNWLTIFNIKLMSLHLKIKKLLIVTKNMDLMMMN